MSSLLVISLGSHWKMIRTVFSLLMWFWVSYELWLMQQTLQWSYLAAFKMKDFFQRFLCQTLILALISQPILYLYFYYQPMISHNLKPLKYSIWLFRNNYFNNSNYHNQLLILRFNDYKYSMVIWDWFIFYIVILIFNINDLYIYFLLWWINYLYSVLWLIL